MLPGIKLVIFDVDNTLVHPKNPDFYQQYSQAVNRAVVAYLGVSLEKATEVADFYRQHYGGGERALFSGTIEEYFPEFGNKKPNFNLLYDEMCLIDPTGQFEPDSKVVNLVRMLRRQGKKVVALTDSPEELSRQVLTQSAFNPDTDFDLYLPYTKEKGPYKILQGKEIFSRIGRYFGIYPDKILVIGDSFESDIKPAQEVGMKTCLVSQKPINTYSGLQARSIYQAFSLYRDSL